MHRLAIFASGNGSNAQRIAEYFSKHEKIRIDLILSNNPKAYVLERAKKLHMPYIIFTRHDLEDTNHVLDILTVQGINFIILAGFLWLIPVSILRAYSGRILNIHPALLPKYGGKGMYGLKVHEAVLNAGDKESGISIHSVNEKYDEGQIIFQARCPVEPGDTPETLAARVHELEYRYYPEIIEKVIRSEGLKD
jgi:phosphoribosylglycinamide formyltransferase-1